MSDNIIAFATPVFLLSIIIERKLRPDLYQFADTVADLACGAISQALGIVVKLSFAVIYAFLVDKYALSSWPEGWLGWALAFLLVDFVYYWFHRLSHGVNFLWAAHVVHHSSEEYNFAVALRQGAVQGIFNGIWFLPIAFTGMPVKMLLISYATNLVYQFWIHTRTVGKLGRFVELIFNTPSHHRVHHGVNPIYIDRNHAGVFIIWDRLFGSFQEETEEVVFGITTPLKSFDPLWAHVQPFVALATESRRTRRLRDKILVWLRDPGWRPADLGGRSRPKPITRAEQTKYNVLFSEKIYYYVLLQFLILLALSLFLEPLVYRNEALAAGLLAVFIIAGFSSLAGLLEKKSWARIAEPVRHGLLILVALALG
ncbi:MAG: sterol desaturase family protein [Bdellovibrionia bacterium]